MLAAEKTLAFAAKNTGAGSAPPVARTRVQFSKLLDAGCTPINAAPAVQRMELKLYRDMDFARRAGRCPVHRNTRLRFSGFLESAPCKVGSCPRCGFSAKLALNAAEKSVWAREHGRPPCSDR